MENHNIRLTSAEIAALWTTYYQCSATRCFYKHFLQYLKDKEIKPLIEEALSLDEEYLRNIEKIYIEEKLPIPVGFSDKDVDLSAPALYSDLFALSFVYRAGQMIIVNYATVLGKMARTDIYTFFEECLNSTTLLYKKSLNVMLSKGIYDRPPYMEYPQSVEFVHKQPSLFNAWFGKERPLNGLELSELFFAIERNSIGLILLIGFIQVSKDKEIKEYLLKGKKLSEKQIETFNEILKDNESFPTFPVTMEVTDSIISPFSEKLMMFFISSSNQIGLSTVCYAMSVSMRKDIGVQYLLFLTEIMKYGSEGLEIMIQRGWMEQPPQSMDRKNLYK